MKRKIPGLMITGISGVIAGWMLAGLRDPGAVKQDSPELVPGAMPRFQLSESRNTPLEPTKRSPRTRQGSEGADIDVAGLVKIATMLLDSPDAVICLSRRLELAETLAAIAKVDPKAAIALAARLPAGDRSSAILDHLAHALIASHGKDAPRIVAEAANAARRHEMLQHLMSALSLRDPRAAFEMGIVHQLFRDAKGVHLLFLNLGESDPLAAADLIKSLPLSSQRQESSIAVAAAWAKKDPQAALEWVGKLTPTSLRERCQTAALEQFALADPSAALELAVKAPALQSAGYLSTVLSSWSRIDPSAAAAAARSLPQGRLRDQALASLGTALSGKDPAMAAELLDDINSGPQAHALASSMAAEWSEIDAPATLRWIETLPESLRERALESSLARLANNAPELAAEFAERATATPALADQIGFIAAAMASKDPEAALKWAGRFESETSATQIRQATLLAWSAQDPVAALRAAVALESQDRDSLVSQVAAQWAAVDPKATLEWARSIEGDLGMTTRGKALESLAMQDPVVARAEIEKLMKESNGDPPLSDPLPHTMHPLTEGTSAVVREMAAKNPQAATEWARALPEGAIRREILSRHYTDWATQDPAAALQYAEAKLEGWDRDWTLVSAVFRESESASTYAHALALAPRIQDPAERARAVRLLRNSTVAPADWRQELLSRGFTAAEIDNAGD
ncbi:MAG: hypothetical protein MUF13_08650 [Akkermansiaceae bacterium]|nr:hypothetical protein [Akkermansiaceae bacterium]